MLEKKGTSINIGSFAPIAMIRRAVLGMEDRSPTADGLKKEEEILERAMQQGAFGFSTALIYPPASYTKTDELIALAKVAAKHGGIYISHVRGESFRVKEAIGEAIQIGETARDKQPASCADSAAVKGRLRSMKSICGGSAVDARFSMSAATRGAAPSAPRSATEFATRRGTSELHRRMTRTPLSFR